MLRDGLVRAETLPLVFGLPGTDAMARGTRLRVRVAGVDLLTLELHAALLSVLGEGDAGAVVAEAAEAAEEEEEVQAAAPLHLAIEVDDTAAEPQAAAAGS